MTCLRADQRVPLQAGYTVADHKTGLPRLCLHNEGIRMALHQGKRAAQQKAEGDHR